MSAYRDGPASFMFRPPGRNGRAFREHLGVCCWAAPLSDEPLNSLRCDWLQCAFSISAVEVTPPLPINRHDLQSEWQVTSP